MWSKEERADDALPKYISFLCRGRESRFERIAKTGWEKIKLQRSGTTKRVLAELGSLFIEECRQLGIGIKEMNYSKLPHFDVACIFESTEKRSR